MKLTLPLYLSLLLFSSYSFSTICADHIELEDEIEQTKHIFIAQILSVKMVNENGKYSKNFESEFKVLKGIKHTTPITFNIIRESDDQSMFIPGKYYVIFTNNGKVTYCLNSTTGLSDGYPKLFDFENYFIKSIGEYVKSKEPLDKNRFNMLFQEYKEDTNCFL